MKARIFLLSASLVLTAAVAAPSTAAIEWIVDGIPAHTGGPPTHTDDSKMVHSGSFAYVASRLTLTMQGQPIEMVVVQKIDKCGNRLWGIDGLIVSGISISGSGLDLLPDGSGGVVVVWGQSGDIYAQRVDSNAFPLWTSAGVPVATSPDAEDSPHVTSRGVGGYAITWQNTTQNEIYSQQLSLNGTESWTSGGVRITSNTVDEFLVDVVAHFDGSLPIALYYTKDGTIDFFVQKIALAPMWGANGVSLGTSAATSSAHIAFGPGSGVWVAYEINSGVGRDIRAVRVIDSGLLTDTYQEGNANYDDYDPIVTWGVGNTAHVAYTRNVAGDEQAVMRETGNVNFYFLGPGNPGNQRPRAIAKEGNLATIVVWEDDTNGSIDLYAERITPGLGSVFYWNFGAGIPLTVAAGDQINPSIAATRLLWGNGDFYFSWVRASTDVSVQRIDGASGVFGHPEIKIQALEEPDGDDEGGTLAFQWIHSQLDAQPFIHPEDPVTNYSIWRAVDVLPGYPPDEVCPQPSTGAGGSAACTWEWVANVDAAQLPSYFTTLPTTRDASPGDPAMHFFAVLAEDDFGGYYISEPCSAASHDEIAPGQPIELQGEQIGSWVYLNWLAASGPDVDHYNIRRNIPGGLAFPLIGTSNDLNFTDPDPNTTLGGNYRVAAVDDNGNEGPYTPIVFVGPNPTGIGNDAPPRALRVLHASPNPFADATSLGIGVPRNSDVVVEVFDVAGRRVRRETRKGLTAGWHTIAFDGRDASQRPLASGVYFYRVKMGAEVVTRKIVVAR